MMVGIVRNATNLNEKLFRFNILNWKADSCF